MGGGKIVNMEELFETSLRIKAPSMTLNKHDIGDLGKIVSKATEGSHSSLSKFLVVGSKESVKTENIEKLVNAKWPQNVDTVDLATYGDDKYIRATLEAAVTGVNRIEISGSDSDWVTLRVKEVEDFVAGHRNWHWILHNVTSIFLLSLLLAALLALAATLTFNLSFEQILTVGVFSWVGIIMCARGLLRIFPFILVETGRSSVYSKTRKFLNWFVPTLVAGVVIEIIVQLIIKQ